jgi:hypothetical protein
LPVVWASHIILVAFLRVMPGMIFLRMITTRVIEFSQSLYKMMLQGRSGLALTAVRLLSALLTFVAATYQVGYLLHPHL